MIGVHQMLPLRDSAPLHGWRDLAEGARETWRARNLVFQLTVRDIRIRYKEAVMGFAWAIVMPVLVILSGLIVRMALSTAAGGAVDRVVVLALAVKALAWGFFAGAVGTGTQSVTGSAHLVTKIYFPRAVLPLSATLSQGFDTCIATLALLLALPWLGATVSPALLWVPLLVLLLVGLTLTVNLVLSCANVFFRDVKYMVQVMLTFGIFFTPVFFDASMVGQRGVKFLMLNPLAPILEGLTLVVSKGHNLSEPLVVLVNQVPVTVWVPEYLLYSAAWAIGGLIVSAWLFRRGEALIAEFV